MKKYLGVLCLLLAGVLALFLGLSMIESNSSDFPSSLEDTEIWCDAMLDKPNLEWLEEETKFFGKHCIN